MWLYIENCEIWEIILKSKLILFYLYCLYLNQILKQILEVAACVWSGSSNVLERGLTEQGQNTWHVSFYDPHVFLLEPQILKTYFRMVL